MGRLGLENRDQLVEWIKSQNDKIAKRSDDVLLSAYRGRNAETINKAIEKARSTNFYLGMEPNWLDIDDSE